MMNLLADNEQVIITKGEVRSVNYSGAGNNLYGIQAQLIGSDFNSRMIRATPLDFNNIKMPIVGEIVLIIIISAPSANADINEMKYYFLNTLSVQSNYHNNALPTIANKQPNQNIPQISYEDAFLSGTVSVRSSQEPAIDRTFPEIKNIVPMQIYSGDYLIQGRFGNMIRFTSTPSPNAAPSTLPSWGAGVSQAGSPLTIISNGITSTDELSVETPRNADASIWLASGQSVVFNPSSTKLNLFYNNKSDQFLKDSNSAKQIFINSDRININAKNDNINIFSNRNIAMASERSIHMESDSKIEFESKKISLGLNATHPALLGDVTFDLLNDLIQNLMDLCEELTKEIHLTGVGNSDPPLNSSAYRKIGSNLNAIKSKLPDIKSNLVFLNKSYLAEDKVDEKSKEEFENNKRSG